MATFVKFYCLKQDMGRGVHNLNATDTIKVMLTNTAPNVSTDTVKTDITEITPANGYSAGGGAIASPTYVATITGGAIFSGTDVTITASGGSFGPFQYAVLYNDTASGDPLIGYVDYGAPVTITAPDSYVFDIDPSTGVWQDG